MEKTTVVLPVYNGMPYLADAINSVLRQTSCAFRLLIIDDGSTDGTAAYLSGLDDSRITVVHQPNSGLGASLNRAIDMCHTKYISRMDADDIMGAGRLHEQVRFLEDNEEVVAVGSQLKFIVGEREMMAPRLPCDPDGIRRRLLVGSFGISHPATTFRVESARKVGGYRVDGPGQDLDFFIRLSEIGGLANLPFHLHQMRLSECSYSTRGMVARKIAYDYALKCARLRCSMKPEPTFDEFVSSYKRDFRCRISTFFFRTFSRNYRLYLLNKGRGRWVPAVVRLVFSALSNPTYAAKKVFRLI